VAEGRLEVSVGLRAGSGLAAAHSQVMCTNTVCFECKVCCLTLLHKLEPLQTHSNKLNRHMQKAPHDVRSHQLVVPVDNSC
jgi:hypothetical protein